MSQSLRFGAVGAASTLYEHLLKSFPSYGSTWEQRAWNKRGRGDKLRKTIGDGRRLGSNREIPVSMPRKQHARREGDYMKVADAQPSGRFSWVRAQKDPEVWKCKDSTGKVDGILATVKEIPRVGKSSHWRWQALNKSTKGMEYKRSDAKKKAEAAVIKSRIF